MTAALQSESDDSVTAGSDVEVACLVLESLGFRV